MNLTGRWKGKYKYGKGYSLPLANKTEPFEFDILDNNGMITGNCNDLVVEAIEGNESTLEGEFKDKHISFLKKYKFHPAVDEAGNNVYPANTKCEGVHYTGKLYKKIFSQTPYFTGTWIITSVYTDEQNAEHAYTAEGSWTMTKIG